MAAEMPMKRLTAMMVKLIAIKPFPGSDFDLRAS
jgi:hypothetical protein